MWIDCSAEGLGSRPNIPVFDSDRVNRKRARSCQQVFSAAFIAHVELSYDDDALKNELCEPVHLPHVPMDWLTMTIVEQRNQARWFAEPGLMEWLDASRLNAIRELFAPVMGRPRIRERVFGAAASMLEAANEKLTASIATGG